MTSGGLLYAELIHPDDLERIADEVGSQFESGGNKAHCAEPVGPAGRNEKRTTIPEVFAQRGDAVGAATAPLCLAQTIW